jgi:hypothetical protein
MGEFLLSILGFSEDESHLIYVKRLHRSKFNAGDVVKIAYPNPNRKIKTAYYRVYGFFYPVEVLHELVRSQNPNVVDRNGFVSYQRELQDADIVVAISEGKTVAEVAKEYKWHDEAIKASLVRHKARQYAKREVENTLADEDTSPIHMSEPTEAQKAKLKEVMDVWGLNDEV